MNPHPVLFPVVSSLAGVTLGFLLRGRRQRVHPSDGELSRTRKRAFAEAINQAERNSKQRDMAEALRLIADPPKTCGDPVWMSDLARRSLEEAGE